MIMHAYAHFLRLSSETVAAVLSSGGDDGPVLDCRTVGRPARLPASLLRLHHAVHPAGRVRFRGVHGDSRRSFMASSDGLQV